MTFSIALAQQLLDSDSRFPVSFDLAWQWIGYSRKDAAKRALLEAGFIENEDFHITVEPTTTGIQANLNENIFLTVECFKMWAMMAKTTQGRQVRLYFLECERIAKLTIASRTRLEIIMDLPDPWQAFYDKNFCDRVFKWFGCQFYWTYIYSQFTAEEACKINRLNPPHDGVRPHKIHQFINPEIKTRLTPYMHKLAGVADGAVTREQFELGYARAFGGNDQLRLFKD